MKPCQITGGPAMYYCGIDYHKKYSVVSIQNDTGDIVRERRINQCNKWLTWAFIETAWVAVGCSPYFGGLYKAQHARGKKANTAITITAKRMSQIVYRLLKEHRMYEERIYSGRSGIGLTASAA
jgi:hypothetical protein